MQERERSIDRVRLAAEAAGLTIGIVTMPQSTRTAAEAAAACGTSVARIVKSLIFERADGGGAILLLVSGDKRVDEDAVASRIGTALRRMDARRVRDVTGFAIGGVAPFGSLAPLPAYMDADLLRHDIVWAAAGAPDAVFPIPPADLLRATGARTIAMAA